MNDENKYAKSFENGTSGNVLLPNNLKYLITRTGSDYSYNLNITHRCPRKTGGTVVMLIATTSLDARSLSNLRVEELDGQYFVVNDSLFKHGDQTKFIVENEAVGHLIINAIIKEFAREKSANDDLKVLQEYAPLIMMSCAVILSLSASFWLVFK